MLGFVLSEDHWVLFILKMVVDLVIKPQRITQDQRVSPIKHIMRVLVVLWDADAAGKESYEICILNRSECSSIA